MCSQAPPSPPLPAPLTADTGTNGNRASVSARDSTGGGAIGVRSVSAQPGSHAAAEFSAVTSVFPALAQIGNGRAFAEVRAAPGTEHRSASATVDMSDVSALGGAIRLGGLHWELGQSETGADSRNDRRVHSERFSLDSIAVGPITIPVPSPADLPRAVTSANTLLVPLGLALQLPVASTGIGGDQHTLSPLTIAVGGSQARWAPVVARLLADPNFLAAQKALSGLLFDPANCNELGGLLKPTGPLNVYYNFFGAAAPLVLAILGQALSGSGDIAIELGGVSTNLDDVFYLPATFDFAVTPPSALPTAPNGSTPVTPPLVGVPPDAPAPVDAGSSIEAITSGSRCATTSPAGRPRCWLGEAPLAAVATSAVVLGLLGVDEVHRRRRLSSPPQKSH